MNKTIKFLTVALALTTATQSFPMWNRLRCAASSARAFVAPRINTMRASLPNWTSHLNIRRSAVAIRPAFARTAALRTAAGLGAVAAYANFTKPARAEFDMGVMPNPLYEPEETTLRVRAVFSGDHTFVSDRAKAEFEIVKKNQKLFAKCLSREGTYRTHGENEKTKGEHSDCAELYKKLSGQSAYKNGDLIRWGTQRACGALSRYGLDKDPLPGSKANIGINIEENPQKSASESHGTNANIDFAMTATLKRNSLAKMLGLSVPPIIRAFLSTPLTEKDRALLKKGTFGFDVDVVNSSRAKAHAMVDLVDSTDESDNTHAKLVVKA